jgi:hypothetical protein
MLARTAAGYSSPMTALALVSAAPATLFALAAATIAVRDRCGGCSAHRRFAFVRAGSGPAAAHR